MLAGTLSCLLLIAALLLGGGTRNYLFTDLVVQALASGVLIYGVARLRWESLEPGARQLVLLMALVVAIPLLQLIPLPAFAIQWLPGRSEIYAAREAVGIPTSTFLVWSLDPNATLASLRALLPAAALLLLGVQLSSAWRLRFIAIIVVAALLMVALGVAQVAQGPTSALYFYTPTNKSDAVGLFANRNHYGSMLVIGLIGAFGGVIFHSVQDHRRSRRGLQMLGWLLLGAILLLGIFLSRSRAAVGLATLMSALLLFMALINRNQRRNAFRWLPIIILFGALIAVEFGLNRVLPRFENLEGGQRTDVLPSIVSLTKRFAGTGTGLGSFPAVYEAHEPIEKLGATIINHAHNDWAEIWIDAGFLAVLVVLLFARWFWQRARELRADWASARPENAERLVGALIILSLSLHSLLDYPLRTTALSCVFAVACILFLAPRSADQRSAGLPTERHRTR
jgi:O-antigen ligase